MENNFEEASIHEEPLFDSFAEDERKITHLISFYARTKEENEEMESHFKDPKGKDLYQSYYEKTCHRRPIITYGELKSIHDLIMKYTAFTLEFPTKVNVKLLWLIVEIPMQEETFVNAREI